MEARIAPQKKAYFKITSAEQKRLIEDDVEVVDGYKTIATSINKTISYIEKGNPLKNSLFLLFDNNQKIQALAAVTEKPNSIYVNSLLSAPWNLKLSSDNDSAHQSLAIRGAGTTMVRQVYEFAKSKNKTRLELFSLHSARSFYTDHLKMIPDEDKFYFKVSQDHSELPPSLNIASGNLIKDFAE